jgi:hypothetical protein
MAAKREAEAKAKADKIAKEKDEQRKRAISYHAEALHKALSELLRCASIPEGWEKDAREVLNKADADAAEWMAAVDAEPGRFNIY